MAEIELPVIITAIANSELEGLVAGTLFSQGWSVIYRALDVSSLTLFFQGIADQDLNSLLIYSPDLPGITPEVIEVFRSSARQVIGFANDPTIAKSYTGIFPTPTDATELVSLIRGFMRAPLLRSKSMHLLTKRRARVIALGAPSGSTGCTTVAINLAMELSLLGHEVLLVDGDVRRPSIAPLLDLRSLNGEERWRTIAPHFCAGELTRERTQNLNEYMNEAGDSFDVVIIDLGELEDIGDSLTDRRWASSVVHWSCDNADELWFLGKVDILGIHRMEALVQALSQISIRARVSVLFNMKPNGRRKENHEALFITSTAALRPERILALPRDTRAVIKAEEERATLFEVDDRSALRKAISKMAVEVMN
jgi:hypothetical protein